MTVSSLADKTIESPNHYNGRAYDITRLTPHHTACVATAEQIAAMFLGDRPASCTYAIGYDGSIVCVVPEEHAPWTSASWDNDNRAITFEISDNDENWNISDAAIEAYINLCVDLIQRYPGLGGEYNYTGDESGNVTFHKWFAATACPGPHLGSDELQAYIQSEVNRRLKGVSRKDYPMEFIFHPDQSGHLFYVCGGHISYIPHEDGVKELDWAYKKCHGTDLPHLEDGSPDAPWGWRLFQAMGQEDLYNEIVKGEKPEPPAQSEAPVQSSLDLTKIAELFSQLGSLLKGE
jgi:hypothetical protein